MDDPVGLFAAINSGKQESGDFGLFLSHVIDAGPIDADTEEECSVWFK